jgi:transcriptional regulator with XRE-family HTH domain
MDEVGASSGLDGGIRDTGLAVIRRVRSLRDQQGVSAQTLSDRCHDLGIEVSRGSIANRENGRGGDVSVSELVAFARALDVPVAALLPEAAIGDAYQEDFAAAAGSAAALGAALARFENDLARLRRIVPPLG